MGINRAILQGNVGRDPEIRSMPSGDKVATFSIATEERWRDKDTGEQKQETQWHNIVVFSQGVIKIVEQYVKKGSRVMVEGAIKYRQYKDRDGVERKATEIVLGRFDGRLYLEGAPRTQERDEHGYGTTTTRGASAGASNGGAASNLQPRQSQRLSDQLDDDIPF